MVEDEWGIEDTCDGMREGTNPECPKILKSQELHYAYFLISLWDDNSRTTSTGTKSGKYFTW